MVIRFTLCGTGGHVAEANKDSPDWSPWLGTESQYQKKVRDQGYKGMKTVPAGLNAGR